MRIRIILSNARSKSDSFGFGDAAAGTDDAEDAAAAEDMAGNVDGGHICHLETLGQNLGTLLRETRVAETRILRPGPNLSLPLSRIETTSLPPLARMVARHV